MVKNHSPNKAWYRSKGVQGGMIATLASLGSMYAMANGITVGEGEITTSMTALVGAAGGVYAIIGRLMAGGLR